MNKVPGQNIRLCLCWTFFVVVFGETHLIFSFHVCLHADQVRCNINKVTVCWHPKRRNSVLQHVKTRECKWACVLNDPTHLHHKVNIRGYHTFIIKSKFGWAHTNKHKFKTGKHVPNLSSLIKQYRWSGVLHFCKIACDHGRTFLRMCMSWISDPAYTSCCVDLDFLLDSFCTAPPLPSPPNPYLAPRWRTNTLKFAD